MSYEITSRNVLILLMLYLTVKFVIDRLKLKKREREERILGRQCKTLLLTGRYS